MIKISLNLFGRELPRRCRYPFYKPSASYLTPVLHHDEDQGGGPLISGGAAPSARLGGSPEITEISGFKVFE